jgi:hypothetical protein
VSYSNGDPVIDATWNNPSPYITIEPGGVLYLCVSSSSGSRIYSSLNHGRSWAVWREGGINGGQPKKLVSFDGKFIATAGGAIHYSQDGGKNWTQVTAVNQASDTTGYGAGIDLAVYGSYIFNAATFPGMINSNLFISSTDGTSWDWCWEHSGGADYGSLPPTFGRLCIFSSTKAYIAAGDSTSRFTAKVNSPTYTIADTHSSLSWQEVSSSLDNTGMLGWHRGTRPGIDIANGRMVLQDFYTTGGLFSFAYSEDMGATWEQKYLPADMGAYGKYGLDISCSGDYVFAHKVECAAPGIYRSKDWGESWEIVHNMLGANNAACGVQIDPYSRNYVYAWGPDNFCWSDDYGDTWTCSPRISDATFTGRVTAIRHYYNRAQGVYRETLFFGGLTSDIEVPLAEGDLLPLKADPTPAIESNPAPKPGGFGEEAV